MALIFARQLKSLDYSVVIYSKSDVFRKSDEFTVSDSLNEFVDEVEAVVYGGGGVLLPRKSSSGNFSEFNDDLEYLIKYSSKKKVPLFLISVGGNGVSLRHIFPEIRRQLIKEAMGITVRNKEDLIAVDEAGKKAHFFHDVVWTMPEFFPKKAEVPKTKKRIGINIYTNKNIIFRTGIPEKIFKYLFIKALMFVAVNNSECEFVFFNTESNTEFNAVKFVNPGKNCSNRMFSDMNEDVEFIQDLDLLITNRLHIGTAALSYGIPVINIGAEEKIKLFFENCGLKRLNWRSLKVFRIIFILFNAGNTEKFISSFSLPESKPFYENALNHFKTMDRMLNSVRESSSST